MSVGLLIAVVIILILVNARTKHDLRTCKKLQCEDCLKMKNQEVLTTTLTTNPAVSGGNVPASDGNTPAGFKPEGLVNYGGGVATASDNWAEDIQNMALDPSVKKSHARFVEERLKVSSGASPQSERDDIQTVNSWQGLRRPNFKDVKVGKDARTVPTMDYEEDGLLPKPSPFLIK